MATRQVAEDEFARCVESRVRRQRDRLVGEGVGVRCDELERGAGCVGPAVDLACGVRSPAVFCAREVGHGVGASFESADQVAGNSEESRGASACRVGTCRTAEGVRDIVMSSPAIWAGGTSYVRLTEARGFFGVKEAAERMRVSARLMAE